MTPDRSGWRARALLGSSGGRGREGISAAESTHARVGPPDEYDVRAIAAQLEHAARSPADPAAPVVDGRDVAVEARMLAMTLVARAQGAIDRLENGTTSGGLDDDEIVALESVIRTRGRPALAIQNGRLEALDAQKHPGSSVWQPQIDDHENRVLAAAALTGAVVVFDKVTARPPRVVGTAWLVRDDLVVTNRHVVFPLDGGIRFGLRDDTVATTATIKADYDVTIDFAFDGGPARDQRAVVEAIPYVAEANDGVDAAILKISARSGAHTLRVSTKAELPKWLYVIGHPGPVRKVGADIAAVFGTPDGRKRVCFGQRMVGDVAPAGELVHDASTIGGFSGGCVMGFTADDVAGLHFHGDPTNGNRAITAATLKAHAVNAYL